MKELTDRNMEIYGYMMLGYGYKDIAKRMTITVGTVGNHAWRILNFYNVPDRVTLILKHNNLPNWMDENGKG